MGGREGGGGVCVCVAVWRRGRSAARSVLQRRTEQRGDRGPAYMHYGGMGRGKAEEEIKATRRVVHKRLSSPGQRQLVAPILVGAERMQHVDHVSLCSRSPNPSKTILFHCLLLPREVQLKDVKSSILAVTLPLRSM